ncbi:MAG: hypothetical protein J6M15_05570 [Prevotella sp.]|nr:hypothetical protein [Prevotella sp.]
MKRLTAYILLLTVYLFTSCGAEQQYTSWSCRFIFNNGTYLDQTIAVAINPTIPGIFCKITVETRGGTRYFIFENSQGTSSPPRQWMAEELRNNLRIGQNNGIIIGVQSMGDNSFTAYDLHCPNCARRENNITNPTYPVAFDAKIPGFVNCTVCGDQYDLNSGGLLVKGKEGDKGLERYRNAHTEGPTGRVTVFTN